MEQREYDAGDLILKEGDPSDLAYRIMSGEVEVYTEIEGRAVVLGTVKAGEFLGEMGIIEGKPRSASARAKTHVVAMSLQRGDFLRLMSQDSSSAHRLIVRLCERLRAASRKLAEATVSKETCICAVEEADSPGGSQNLNLPANGPTEQGELRLTLFPASARLDAYLPREGTLVNKFPFSVGRVPIGNESGPTIPIDLSLTDSAPFRLSRQHFALSRHLDRYVVSDLGSTLGTEVNGQFLGYHFGKDSEYLRVGENTITAGGVGSPFTFKILLEHG